MASICFFFFFFPTQKAWKNSPKNSLPCCWRTTPPALLDASCLRSPLRGEQLLQPPGGRLLGTPPLNPEEMKVCNARIC